MNQSFNLKTTAVAARNWIGPATTGRVSLFLALTLVWFAFSPRMQAQCNTHCTFNNNTAVGISTLVNPTTGSDNTAMGFEALQSNTTGNNNTANGVGALLNNNGDNNTATGMVALEFNTTGGNNTANGAFALESNIYGGDNTAVGANALASNTTAGDNTATGSSALYNNTTGFQNTADGFGALFSNNGDNNTATGWNALTSNNIGNNNTANGVQALVGNTSGIQNTATGVNALESNATGGNNTATGYIALQVNTGSNNTANGSGALANNRTGGANIALGASAGGNLTTGSNNIDIGNAGVAGESGKIRIGTTGTHHAAFIAGIHGVTVAGLPVVVNTIGQLGVASSSKRFKEAIKPMDKASEAILALKPVTFQYKKVIDPDRTAQFGLVAEDVAKVNADLVTRDSDGKVYTVRYEAVNAMLLNEFLKEHQRVQELEANAARQLKQIEALAAGLQKVSAQIELRKPAPQTVLNNH
jgi:hypothetical protein